MDTLRPPPIHLSVVLELPERDPKAYEYDFEQPEISLGRDPGNDIQVPLTTVSRRHARLFHERGDYFLEDLGSTHGTKHNGRVLERGERRLLRTGDRIEVVSFKILFEARTGTMMDRQPGERTEQLARRMVQEVLQSIGGGDSERPSLRVMNGPVEGRRLELSEDAAEVVIGRSPDCDIVLDDPNVSRRHCLVKRTWDGFTAQDLGSRNGVAVNGRQLEAARILRDGDELDVGGIRLTFIDPPSRVLQQMGMLEDELDPEGAGETHGGEAPADDLLEPETEDPPPDYYGDEEDLEPPGYDAGSAPYSPPADPDVGGRELPEDAMALANSLDRRPVLDIVILVVAVVALLGGLLFVALYLF